MFKSTIKESSMELNPVERVKYKDTGNAVRLDTAVEPDCPVVIQPAGYVVLEIENDKAEPPVYSQYVIIDKSGTRYVTGSESFWRSFNDIWEELADYSDEWELEIYKKSSKNYSGKYFLSCGIA